MSAITGMDRSTGRRISDAAHLRQSVALVLTTRIGSRPLRRDFGSLLPDLIGLPIDGALRVDVTQAVAAALGRWEPRVRTRRVEVAASAEGRLLLDLHLLQVSTGEELRLSVPV